MLDFYIYNGYTKSTESVKRYTNPGCIIFE